MGEGKLSFLSSGSISTATSIADGRSQTQRAQCHPVPPLLPSPCAAAEPLRVPAVRHRSRSISRGSGSSSFPQLRARLSASALLSPDFRFAPSRAGQHRNTTAPDSCARSSPSPPISAHLGKRHFPVPKKLRKARGRQGGPFSLRCLYTGAEPLPSTGPQRSHGRPRTSRCGAAEPRVRCHSAPREPKPDGVTRSPTRPPRGGRENTRRPHLARGSRAPIWLRVAAPGKRF